MSVHRVFPEIFSNIFGTIRWRWLNQSRNFKKKFFLAVSYKKWQKNTCVALGQKKGSSSFFFNHLILGWGWQNKRRNFFYWLSHENWEKFFCSSVTKNFLFAILENRLKMTKRKTSQRFLKNLALGSTLWLSITL